MNQSAEQDHLEFDYLLNRSKDSDIFRKHFGVESEVNSNVSIISYSRCQTPHTCDFPEHFVHLATFYTTKTKKITATYYFTKEPQVGV